MTTAGEYFKRATAAAESSNWPQAAESLQAALELKPNAATWRYIQLGEAREKSGDRPGGLAAYREAVGRRQDPPPRWHFLHGRAEARQHNWTLAAEAYERAFEGRQKPPPLTWYFRRGTCYERLRRWKDARRVYREALEVDPTTTEVDRELLRTEVHEFPGRRMITRFVGRHLDEIRAAAAEPLAGVADRSDDIYVYWAQGFEQGPEVVQLCHRRLLQHTSAPVRDLDDQRIAELAELPADIEGLGINRTHRSDLLRLELLARYGGTWLDATCLVTGDPSAELRRLRDRSGFFAFAKRQTTIGNWLLSSSSPDHYLVRMLREALHLYWRERQQLKNYFLFHYVFEALVLLDERFGQIWRDTPRVPYTKPFMIRWHLLDRYEPEAFDAMINGAFVHKLTYKYDPEKATTDTMIGHLLATQ